MFDDSSGISVVLLGRELTMGRKLLIASVLLAGMIASFVALKSNSSNAATTIPIGVDAYSNHIASEPAGLTYVYKYIVPGGQSIVQTYINTAYANGKKPVLVVYTNYDSTTPDWTTWDATMNVIRQDGRQVDVVVEPDLFGYIKNNNACGTTGRQDVDRFLSTAPANAKLGFFISPWNLPYTTPASDAAAWKTCWLAAGGDRMPNIYVDVSDRDQEYKGTYPWPASKLQVYEDWFEALSTATGRKISIWQIPLGNSQCLNGRRSTFVESWLVQSKLTELSPYVNMMLFGPGIEDYDAANTQSWNLPSHVKYDCGMFNSRVTALSNGSSSTNTPVAPTATRTSTPVPPTATRTSTPVPPTATSVAPTATRTNTPVPPTATRTAGPPATNTPVPPTATRTNTPVPPTATRTPVPPTATVPPTGGSVLKTEAETLSLPTGYGQTYGDSSASGGRALLVWSNSSASSSVNLPSAATRVRVVARGDQCAGAPLMRVLVDGKQVYSTYVWTSGWATYSRSVSIPAGWHTVAVSFANDYYGSCDRNLRVDSLEFTR